MLLVGCIEETYFENHRDNLFESFIFKWKQTNNSDSEAKRGGSSFHPLARSPNVFSGLGW